MIILPEEVLNCVCVCVWDFQVSELGRKVWKL